MKQLSLLRPVGLGLLGAAIAACSGAPREVALAAELGVSNLDPSHGFPLWYEDGLATRLAPCLDAGDPNCVLAADPGFDPAQPLAFPENFPSEFFYTVADSDRVTTPGCPEAGVAAGRAFVRAAVEGTFLDDEVIPGEQIAFGRIRIVASGLCPLTTYEFTHPHGVELITTDALGAVAANAATEDIGCEALPCNFALAEPSRVFTDFIRWDPAVAPAAPAGYLGDATVPHAIVGTPNREFRIADLTGLTLASTSLFTVSGKLAGPLLAAPSKLEVGGQVVATASAGAAIVITNVKSSAVAIASATVSGPDAADFAVDTGCTGAALARDATCTVRVTFTPSTLARRNATLTLVHDGGPLPLVVPLTGTGIAAGATPHARLDVTALAFGDQRVGTTSARQTVTIGNQGNAPLGISAIAPSGPDAGQFTVVDDRCSGKFLDPGATCLVRAVFAPTIARTASASLQLTDNDPAGPHLVALTGTGFGGYAAVATTLDGNGFPAYYQDEQGIQVQPCLQQVAGGGVLTADPRCVLLADATFDPSQPLVFPSNFPGEFFYQIADSADVPTPGCPASGVRAGTAMVRMAVEGTFANDAPVAGEQIVFQRTRFTARGLCPLTSYRVTYPYGVAVITTDEDGRAAGHLHTTDTGCAGAPCDFAEALRGSGFGGLLHWDGLPPAAPLGYLGDPNVPHTVVGATFTAPGELAPANYFRIEDLAGNVIGSTSLFSVSGKQGALVSSAAPLAFGARAVGSGGVAQLATITNADAVSVAITGATLGGANPTDFAIASNGCTGATLSPGQSCAIGVAFAPTAPGARSASVTVAHSGSVGAPLVVVAAGSGGTPAIALDATALAFDDQVVATTSTARSIVAHNAGTAPLALGAVALAGSDPVSFAITGDGCSGQSIAIGASCTVSVVFTPTTSGARAATLVFDTAAPGPHSVALSGAGVALSLATSIAPSSLAFGNQTVAIASAPRRITVTNVSTGALPISVAPSDASPDFAVSANACTASLPAGASCTFDVGFAPVATGTRSGLILVADGTGQQGVAVTGTGVLPAVSLAPSSLAFAAQQANTTSAARSFVVTNTGPGVLRIASTSILGADAASFSTTANTCAGATIAAGATCSISVAFRPSGFGPHSAQLALHDNTLVGEQLVPLSGTGNAPQLGVSVSPLGFGLIRVGSDSKKSFNVLNTGNQNLTVGAMTVSGVNAGDFSVTRNRCTAAVAPGRNCSVDVTFAPGALGERTATLSIASSDPRSPSALPLTGTGK